VGLDEEICNTKAYDVEIQPRPTPRVEQTLKRAGSEAARRGHDYLGTEHLLLAIIADPDGIAGRVLRDLGVDELAAERVREIMDSQAYNT
jgi:ATP-dependent Clp protease ATP-binding subunit ClpA